MQRHSSRRGEKLLRPEKIKYPKVVVGALSTLHIEKDKKARKLFKLLADRLPKDCHWYFLVASNADKPKVEGNFLHLPIDECYENLPLKTYWFVRYCREFGF